MKSMLLALLSCVALAQTPTFDVAEVHVSKPASVPNGGFIPGSGRIEFGGFTLVDLIRFAYGLDDDMITGGPDWLSYSRFDVYAKGARGSSDDTVKQMLRALLADRFKLVFHSVEKPMPAFALTVGKRILMKEAAEGEDTNCQPQGNNEDGQVTVVCKNVSMAGFAERFHQYAGGYVNHPMVDQTGLKGGYNFTIKWTAKGMLTTAPNGISFFDAAEKQLGLKVEAKKLPVSIMAIDSVSDTPTPNAPGVKETLRVAETEFEVAEIRLSPPGMKQEGGFKPGGRLDFRAVSIKDLLPFAYDVENNMIVGWPKWMETDKFDIVAKPPREVSLDALKIMLRTLLIERFKLETHKEEQSVPVFVVTVSKKGSKLEKSSAGSGTGCKPGSANDMLTLTCKGTTVAQFTELIHRYAGGYFDHAVVDDTGLEGRFDFILSWTPRGKLQAAGGAQTSSSGQGSAPVASDPGGISVFEAIDRQLGLKVDSQKRPMPVIVIDKASPLVQ